MHAFGVQIWIFTSSNMKRSKEYNKKKTEKIVKNKKRGPYETSAKH